MVYRCESRASRRVTVDGANSSSQPSRMRSMSLGVILARTR